MFNFFRRLTEMIFGVRILVVLGEKFDQDDPKNHLITYLPVVPRIGESLILCKYGQVRLTKHKINDVQHSPYGEYAKICIFVEENGSVDY